MRMSRRSVMQIYFLLGCSIVGLIWCAFSYFLPVGSVNGRTIYSYELNDRLKHSSGNAVKNIGKDIAFYKAMSELGITVNENEIEQDFKGYVEKYGGINELERILLDTQGDIESLKESIKKGLYSQKAIKHFSDNAKVSDDEVVAKYNSDKLKYGEDFAVAKKKITEDLLFEKGTSQYNEFMKKKEGEIVIKVY